MAELRESRPTRRQLLKLVVIGGGTLAIGPSLLAACGPAGPTAGSSPTAGGKPKAGGTLRLGVVGDMSNFDPYQNVTTNFPILQNLNSFLIYYTDKLEALPGAAKSWNIASDHSSVTLKLNPDIKFHSGKAFTSADLIAGLQRAKDPKEGGNLLSTMAIVGDFNAPDAQTVVIKFVKQVPDLLITDFLSGFPIVDKDKNSSASLATAPAGSGPFKLVSRTPNANIKLAKYEGYWNTPLPYLDGATIEIFESQDTMASGLRSGSIDGALYMSPLTAKSLGENFEVIRGYPGALVNLLRVNPTTPPFDNLKLRQAMQRAVNRDRIVKDVFFGFSTPTVLPWGPNSPAFDASYSDKLKFDLAAAKQLWQEAGSPPSGVALANGGDALALQMLQIIQEDLKTIGFDLKIASKDTQTFLKELIAGEFGAVLGGVGNASKSPSRIVTNSLFRTSNNPLWKDKLPKDYVDAIAASESALTDTAAKAANARLNAVITDLAWGIGINVPVQLFAFRKGIVGFARDVDDRVVLERTGIA